MTIFRIVMDMNMGEFLPDWDMLALEASLLFFLENKKVIREDYVKKFKPTRSIGLKHTPSDRTVIPQPERSGRRRKTP